MNKKKRAERMTKEELKPIDVSKYTVTENGNVIKDKLKQEARQKALEWNDEKINGKYNRPPIANWSCYEKGYLAGAEPREKCIAELEKEISVLLSCKNCPENKGGLICQKEYENKCLTQKIQYIKELQEENAELKHTTATLRQEKDNTNMHAKAMEVVAKTRSDQLTKAKEIIEKVAKMYRYSPRVEEIIEQAEQFISEVEK